MSLPLLPRWLLPSPFPSVYDMESSTPIEMVAKLYGTIKTLAEEYNKFVDEINAEIRNFTNSSNEEIENFKEYVERRVRCKFEELDDLLAKMRLEMKKYTDSRIDQAFEAFGVTVKATGAAIMLTDATNEKLRAMSIFGRTSQRWSPTPEYPAELQSVGDSGIVTVAIRNATTGESQALTVETPEGLPGIPVASGGNYTDPSGQRWICDEIDLKRGVYIQRVAKETLSGTPDFAETADVPGRYMWKNCVKNAVNGKSKCISNFASWIAWGVGQRETDYFCVTYNHLYFAPSAEKTSEEVNALFDKMIKSATPPVIIAPLDNENERPLTAAELAAYKKLHTYMPNTTISSINGADLLVEYVAITQKYLENHIHEQVVEITTQMVNEAIKNGEIVVGLEYDEETESANIIVGGET